jgi:phospholipase C
MEAGNRVFGAKSAGAAFHVYAPAGYRHRLDLRTRAYAVAPGGRVTDQWELGGFEGGQYRLCICGPNGFLRELAGSAEDPQIVVRPEYQRSGDLVLVVANQDKGRSHTVQIANHMYKGRDLRAVMKPGGEQRLPLRLADSHCWYDFTVHVAGADGFARRFAGRVETGKPGYSDPVMGGLR